MSGAADFSSRPHVEVRWLVAHWATDDYYQPEGWEGHMFPEGFNCGEAATLWKNVGEQLFNVGKDVKEETDRVLTVWKGEAADAFKKKAYSVACYAYQLAKIADSDNEIPSDVIISDEGTFERPEEIDIQHGFKQICDQLKSAIDPVRDKAKLPDLPWKEYEDKKVAIEAYYGGWDNVDDVSYRFKRPNFDGDEIYMPNEKANDRGVPQDEMLGYYDDAKCGRREDKDLAKYPDYDSYGDGAAYDIHVYVPQDLDKFLVWATFNKDEEKTCRDTGNALATAYQDAGKDMPSAPKKPPQLTLNPQAFNGQPSGPGGPGGPGSPGMPDTPSTPSLPDRPPVDDSHPDLPDDGLPDTPPDSDGDGIPDDRDPKPNEPGLPDTPSDDQDGDGIPDHKDPYPNDPNNRFPGDPERNQPLPDLPDSDGDGIPDNQDHFPDDPDHNRDGIPDGQDWPGGGGGGGSGDVDSGTVTARAGGGPGLPDVPAGGSSYGNGPSGVGSGGIGSGGPGGSGAAGAGVGAGIAGGYGGGASGSGAAGVRGPGASGMMPMGGGMGGGMGGQEGGEEQGRNTWLDEDEDVWGTNDNDAPPPVLGGS